jgi:NADH:ubiquinone oxidoreductase subunit E
MGHHAASNPSLKNSSIENKVSMRDLEKGRLDESAEDVK